MNDRADALASGFSSILQSDKGGRLCYFEGKLFCGAIGYCRCMLPYLQHFTLSAVEYIHKCAKMMQVSLLCIRVCKVGGNAVSESLTVFDTCRKSVVCDSRKITAPIICIDKQCHLLQQPPAMFPKTIVSSC